MMTKHYAILKIFTMVWWPLRMSMALCRLTKHWKFVRCPMRLTVVSAKVQILTRF
jgi:hypothetical protein